MKRHFIICLTLCELLLKPVSAVKDAVVVSLEAKQKQTLQASRKILFTPFDPVTKPCPENPQMQCQGVLPLDIGSNSEIKFNWFASKREDKYLSITVDHSTAYIEFEFQARHSCAIDSYQEITGDDLSVDVELQDRESLPSGFKLNKLNSMVALGRCIGCNHCEIFSKIRYDLDHTVKNFSLNIYRISNSAKYDKQKVAKGTNDFIWSDRLRWSQFGEQVIYSFKNRPTSRPSLSSSTQPSSSLRPSPAPAPIPLPTPEVGAASGQVPLAESSGYSRWFSSLLIASVIGIVIMVQ